MPATVTPRKPQTLARKLVETRNTSRNRGLAAMLGLGESERDAIRSNASAVNDVYGRGTLAGFLGIPGDLGGMMWDAGAAVNNKIKDVEIALGLVSPKQARYVPSGGMAYGGAEHIGQKMQEYGLVSPTRRPVAETLASLISPTGLYATAAKAPQMARAGVRMLDNLAAPRTMGSQTGAIENLWHGSPHTFDRFDLSKIGTGEGAQAYGHGAYLAESKGVADSYRRGLTNRELQNLAADSYDQFDSGDDAFQAIISNPSLSESQRNLISALKDDDWLGFDYPHQAIGEVLKNPGAWDLSPKTQAALSDTGNLYQTRLAWPDPAREATDPLSPDHFLHWDKPLSEQPEVAKRLGLSLRTDNMIQADADAIVGELQSRGGVLSDHPDLKARMDALNAEYDRQAPKLTGADFYRGTDPNNYMHSFLDGGNSSPSRSRELFEQGIPGIRYLDGGSRGAGAGSHNYVVFDDRLIDIVSRNGQPVGNLGKMVAPQDEALRVAQQNAAKPIEEGGLGLRPDNTPEERAAAMGFDTPVFHATRSQKPFDEFRAGKWGSTYLAASPNRAMNGASAGATDLSHLYAATDGADVRATAVMPLMVRGNDIATLRPPKDIWDKLPEVASGDDVDALAKSVGGNYWWDVYDEIPIRSSNGDVIGEQYVKKQFPSNEYGPHSTPWQASDNMLPGYNSASDVDSLAKVERIGQKGFLVSDEAGSSIVAGQNMPIRSRFAAFDPMRRDSSDILAGLAPLGLGAWMYQDEPVK